jgi:DNA-directed RNA polymerase subunit RPC12/RpoP
MTLRDYLAQDRYLVYAWLPLIALCIGAPASACCVIWLRGSVLFVVLAIFACLAAYFAATQLLVKIHCPRCSKPLGQLACLVVLSRLPHRYRDAENRAEKLGKCPHCGLRLDEEIGTKAL